jgi:hypothetical protein
MNQAPIKCRPIGPRTVPLVSILGEGGVTYRERLLSFLLVEQMFMCYTL